MREEIITIVLAEGETRISVFGKGVPCAGGRRKVKNALTLKLDSQQTLRFNMAQCNNEQQFTGVGFQPLTKHGHPAKLDPNTPVEWSSSDETIMKAVPHTPDDGLVDLVAQGGLGTVTITVRGDADLGDGVTPVEGSEAIVVVAAGAASIGLTLPAPTDQP